MDPSHPENYEDLKQHCLRLQNRVGELEEIVRLLRYRRFGRSSETIENLGIRPLFDDHDDNDNVKKQEPEVKEREVKAHTRKIVRKALPEDLPREEVIVDLDDSEKVCDCCNSKLIEISRKTSEKLKVIPAKVVVEKTIRPVYSCKKCETLTSKNMPYHPIPKSSLTIETFAHIICSKYLEGMPLYRQEKFFKRHGVDISRDKMARSIVSEIRQKVVDEV